MAETSSKGINKISFSIKQMPYRKGFCYSKNETILRKQNESRSKRNYYYKTTRKNSKQYARIQ